MKKVTEEMLERYGCCDCADVICGGKNGAISNMRCTHDGVCPYHNDFKPFKRYVDWLAANDVEYGFV